MKNQQKNLLLALAATAALYSTSALAAPILSFDFETSGGFYFGSANGSGSYGTCSNGGPAACDLTLTSPDTLSNPGGFQTYNTVSWGSAHSSSATGDQSNLTVAHRSDSITTDGSWFTIDEFIHTNNILNAGASMTSVGVYGLFELVGGIYSLGSEYPLLFSETTNADPCQPGTPGSISDPVCPDFYLTLPLTGSDSFIIDDYQYFISFRFMAGPGAVVDEVEIDGTNFARIWTSEGNPGVSTIFTEASISFRQIPTQVPAPATLALFGLSLLGLRLFRRRS